MTAGDRDLARWERIQAIFDEAIDVPPAERDALLASACGDEHELRREVESLLEAHETAETFLEGAGIAAVAPWLSDPPAGKTSAQGEAGKGLHFGPYRVIRELGRGGMGTVFLAERADDRYQRTVAIKLVRTFGGESLERRFQKEQRILASLEHPSIARLYDAGTTPAGQPFLVMEHVRGSPIDAYCEERGLPVDDRLRLFDRVCRAVEFAHGRLIVHRDLKPSNILVTDEGVPKLLDFGVARLLAVDEEADSNPTTVGARAMTPEYASPEQLRGDPVSTSTDVWALGVLLYRLLTGRHPYRFGSRSPQVVERTLQEARAALPSAAVLEEGAPDATARARRLRGDLDTITMAALRLEPDRRYGTVAELRADVEAHLRGFPVGARPDSWRYRAGKFARRNRVAVSAAVAVLLAVLGGSAAVAWQGRVAQREARRAEATRDYLIGMFEALDPDAARGPSVPVEQLLDEGAGRLEAAFEGEPDTGAEVAGVLGSLYQRIGAFEKARPLLEDARGHLLARHGPDHPESVAASARLAWLLHEQGEVQEAEALARDAVAVARTIFGPRTPELAERLGDLGAMLNANSKSEEAAALHREALAIHRSLADSAAIAADLNALGLALDRLGEYDEALRIMEESLQIRRAFFGERHTEVALSLLDYASVLQSAGKFDEAIELLEECLSIRRELLGDRHPNVAYALNHIGLAQQRRGDLDAAEDALGEALSIRRESLGEDHLQVGTSLNNLAVVSYFAGDYALAAERFRRAVAIWTDELGDEHQDVLSGLNNLGASLRAAGELDEAEQMLRRVLEVRIRTLPDGHAQIAQSHSNLADVLVVRGRYGEAEASYQSAIAGWRDSLGEDHPNLAFGLYGLGKLYERMGQCARAETPLREALAIRQAALDAASTDIAVVRAYLGFCRLARGAAAEADSLLRLALPPIESRWGAENELTVRVREALGRAAAAGAPRDP
ncbi:MAG TPA: serine/threonine-protein kinase [Longimicrobiales bacterium]|nr:serine/threonine-protein kinase [Longimicrobiales bacterium]